MTIFLYTKGTEGNIPQKLKELLAYMEHTTEERVCNKQLEKLHRMVEAVKRDSEVSHNYMKIFEREEMIREEAEEIGRMEGVLQTLFEMVEDSVITIQYAAKKVNMDEEAFVVAMTKDRENRHE